MTGRLLGAADGDLHGDMTGDMQGMHHAAGGSGVWVLVIAAIAASAYCAGVLRLRGRGVRWPAGRSVTAALGLLAVAAAAVLPPAGFPLHVVGHLLLTMLGPLCLALSAPVTLALRTLPPRGRHGVLAVVHSRFVKILTLPAIVLLLEVAGMYAFYLTPLFQAAHEQPWLGTLLHLHMFLAGCLFSWYLVGRDPMPQRPSLGTALGVLLVAAAAHDILAKLMYSRGLPAGADTLEQVRLGAQLMYYGGTIVETGLAVALMTAWYRRTGRALQRDRRREASGTQIPATAVHPQG